MPQPLFTPGHLAHKFVREGGMFNKLNAALDEYKCTLSQRTTEWITWLILMITQTDFPVLGRVRVNNWALIVYRYVGQHYRVIIKAYREMTAARGMAVDQLVVAEMNMVFVRLEQGKEAPDFLTARTFRDECTEKLKHLLQGASTPMVGPTPLSFELQQVLDTLPVLGSLGIPNISVGSSAGIKPSSQAKTKKPTGARSTTTASASPAKKPAISDKQSSPTTVKQCGSPASQNATGGIVWQGKRSASGEASSSQVDQAHSKKRPKFNNGAVSNTPVLEKHGPAAALVSPTPKSPTAVDNKAQKPSSTNSSGVSLVLSIQRVSATPQYSSASLVLAEPAVVLLVSLQYGAPIDAQQASASYSDGDGIAEKDVTGTWPRSSLRASPMPGTASDALRGVLPTNGARSEPQLPSKSMAQPTIVVTTKSTSAVLQPAGLYYEANETASVAESRAFDAIPHAVLSSSLAPAWSNAAVTSDAATNVSQFAAASNQAQDHRLSGVDQGNSNIAQRHMVFDLAAARQRLQDAQKRAAVLMATLRDEPIPEAIFTLNPGKN